VPSPARSGKDKIYNSFLEFGKEFFYCKNMNSDNGLSKNLLAGFVPRRIEIEGRPELQLFPLNILFAGLKNEDGKLIMGTSVYEPDLTSFREDREMLSMKYDNIYGESQVIIEYNTVTKYWLGTKYIKGGSAGGAIGMDWHMFFSHFTMLGLANFEPCKMEVMSTVVN
jgi:hypothetical protein